MGIPGMKRVLENFFLPSIMTSFDFISSMHDSNILCIDGNIALYETKNQLPIQSPLTAEDVLSFCSEIAEHVNASKCVIVFDGLAPIQKLPEQIKRRKRRYNEYTELERDKAFDLSSVWYQSFIQECEDLFVQNGWKVLSHNIIGEGEQKIADYIRYLVDVTDERCNIICWSKDWDILVILVNIELPDHIAVYLQMALQDLTQLISINKIQYELSDLRISPLHFMACAIMFGCDFFPGLQSMKLTPSNFDILIRCEQFISLDGRNIKIDLDKLYHTLSDLKKFSSDYRSMSSSDSYEDSSTNMILYSNVKPLTIPISIEDCGGSCLLCDTKKHCSTDDMEYACFQYLNMFVWTLEYFSGLLDYKMSDQTDDVYISHLSPTISSLMKWLAMYELETKDNNVNIITKESYGKAMQQGLSLQFYELQPCRYIESYQAPIICKNFSSLEVFQHQS